jgi:hypothetical protein
MPRDLVTIATYRFLPEAEAARLCLEAEGLLPFLADVEIVNMDWLLGNAVGNIKLQVPRAQAEQALELLEQRPAPPKPGHPRLQDPDATYCLSCGAMIPDHQTCCPSCGWSYGAEAHN